MAGRQGIIKTPQLIMETKSMPSLNLKHVPLCLVDHGKLPLNPDGLATAIAMKNGVVMPPIKLERKSNGRYILKDGRHRFLAHKLNGKKTIWANVHERKE